MAALLDWSDASLEKFINEWMPIQLPKPFNDIKELLLELALRMRELRKLAKVNYEVKEDGVRWVRASDLLSILDD